ncbi:DMT family transporter [Saccharophagus degradans]|uniref:EamA domain-containing protein n=1 Tax=Saccharophagus degradans (strain 2-40 / ATCC 43961 / DSM 17024) TaxID=203122 RepID=Q21JI0_SACD2|nr:DMT family transporter [Saccharophagus degradans]ABD81149.1 protein of unknown function DUF6, transmembrane [Saccharophagus degradans 2-40]
MFPLSKTNLAVVILFAASILWGLTWIPLKFFQSVGIEGVWLLLVTQGLLASAFLRVSFKPQYFVSHWKPLLAITFFGGGAILFFTLALMYGEIIRVMVLFYLLPVWGVLGGRLFLGERIDLIRGVCVAAAVSGALLILGGFEIFNTPPTWLDVIALLSGLFFAANNIMFRAVETVPVNTKLWLMFIGCTSMAAMLIAFGVQHEPPQASQFHWLMLAGYALTWLLLANLGSQWAVTQLEAGRSSIIIIMELVAAVISALLIAGESLSPMEWVGCALVVVAALLEATRAS